MGELFTFLSLPPPPGVLQDLQAAEMAWRRVTTTVEVTEAAAIDTTTAQVQSNYDARMAQELPMSSVDVPGRNQGALTGKAEETRLTLFCHAGV